MKVNGLISSAKGIGITFVVIGHTAVNSDILGFIYQFHMALFFFISGTLYNDKYDFEPVVFIKKRLKSLYMPYLKYGLITLFCFCFIHYFAYGNLGYKLFALIRTIILIILGLEFSSLGGTLWFLRALFIVSVLFLFIRVILLKFKFSKSLENLIMLLFAIVCILIALSFNFKYNFGSALVMLLFYCVGFILKPYWYKISFNFYAFLISTICVYIISKYNTADIAAQSYGNVILMILSAIMGIYAVMYLSNLLMTKKVLFFDYLGERSLEIMALHFLAFKLVHIVVILYYNLPIQELISFPVIILENTLWQYVYIVVGLLIPSLYFDFMKWISARKPL